MAKTRKPLVGIIMGSDSDLHVMEETAKVCKEMGVGYEISVISAHRAPKDLYNYAEKALRRGVRVIVAGAGGAAHLPGVIAAITTLPVIGIPISTKSLHGLDSLLSIVQMPPGVPVATVGIDAGKNAGLLACQVLATHNTELALKLASYKLELYRLVRSKNRAVKHRHK